METVRKAFMSQLDFSIPPDYNRFGSSGILMLYFIAGCLFLIANYKKIKLFS